LEKPPPAAHISYKQEMVGERYGWVRIISPEKRWNKKWNHCHVLTQCVGCKRIQWSHLGNLRTGKSKGCQSCSQPMQIPRWLDRRLTQAKQRCQNPNNPQYHRYGERGIEFKFNSILEAGLWILANVENVKIELEMDRINNEGHYEEGNIRFVERSINQANRKLTLLTRWNQEYWPYARSVVSRKLRDGMNREQIIKSAEDAVINKRKNWRLIEARLEFMTYEMPEDIIVLPYREN
jgi:hypothetical protein